MSIILIIISIIILCIALINYQKGHQALINAQQIKIEKDTEKEQYIESLNKEIEINTNKNISLISDYTNKVKQLDSMYNEKKESIELNLTKDFENYQEIINNKKNQLNIDYNNYAIKVNSQKDEILENILKTKEELDNIKSTLHAANDAIIRQQEIEDNKDFYTLQIDNKYIYEIGVIKSIENQLSDPRPLRMLIWTTYYSKKANDLCNRVIGSNKKTGIYKITCLKDNKSYIGQAKDIKDRWREHMKCGLGIDAPAGNKLYQSMLKNGLENFTFEMLEECSSDLLNEKEKFYIDVYDTYNFGYNSNKGVSK